MRTVFAAYLAFGAVSVGAAVSTAAGPQSPTLAATTLLEHYLAGRFDDAVTALAAMDDYTDLLEQLKRDGAAWVDAAGVAERQRRELAAATFAIEAARVSEWKAWKEIAIVPIPLDPMPVEPTFYRTTYWKPPPLLIEWGCELLRRAERPGPTELIWQLAALAVAERAQDHEFLAGDQTERGHYPSNVIPNATVAIRHLAHVRPRFPDEPRLKLAEGIAEEWHEPTLAKKVFEQLKDDIDAGGEATMRLGAIAFRAHDDDGAIALLRRTETLTRDPWVLTLARYFTGLAHERRKRLVDAERAYRGALAASPKAESASMALGSLLFRTGRRAEGSLVIESMLNASPKPRDPWRTYVDADDRFWPQLLARLRAEIRR